VPIDFVGALFFFSPFYRPECVAGGVCCLVLLLEVLLFPGVGPHAGWLELGAMALLLPSFVCGFGRLGRAWSVPSLLHDCTTPTGRCNLEVSLRHEWRGLLVLFPPSLASGLAAFILFLVVF